QDALLLEHAAQIGALHEAHRDVQAPLRIARLEHRDHVRMIKTGRKARLPEEAAPEPLVVSEPRTEQLQRYAPPQPEIVRAVDLPHPAATRELRDPIAGELLADPGLRLRTHDRAECLAIRGAGKARRTTGG